MTKPNQLDKDIDEILIKGLIAYTGNDKLFFTIEPTRQAIKSLIAKAQTEARIDELDLMSDKMYDINSYEDLFMPIEAVREVFDRRLEQLKEQLK